MKIFEIISCFETPFVSKKQSKELHHVLQNIGFTKCFF